MPDSPTASVAGQIAGGPRAAASEPLGRSPEPLRLVDWLHVFARPYRLAMGAMVGLNLLSAITMFVELELLRALTIVLSRAPVSSDAACTLGAWARAGFSIEPVPCGARLPFLLLPIYTLIVLLQGAFDYAALAVNTRLTQAARRDVERELLRNLLLQNDAFFLRRAPSEIISRLGGDLQRVGARRQMATQGIATTLSVIAVVWVLALQSPIAALVGVLVSLVGVFASQPLLGRLRGLDQSAIEADDRVKAALEDTLGGVAEIEVSGFAPRMLAAFSARQRVRDGLAVRNADLNNLNGATQKLTFSFGFIAVLVLFAATEIFGPLGGGGDGGLDRAALIVLLISTLPQLYFKLGELTQILSHFQIAAMSYDRIAQYEAPRRTFRQAPSGEPVAPGAIALRGLRYQFGPGDPVLGGPRGISLDIPATGLLGIVGPSGAGKSTLIRLLLGRQEALDGTVAFGDGGGREGRFVYLPQRPVVFDGTLRDNLLLASPDGPRALAARAPALTALGVLALVRRKGLDAFPGAADTLPRMGEIRSGFRDRLGEAAGGAIRPLGRDAAAPRQLVIEAQLGRAVDQGALARRMVSPLAREPVRKLASGRYGAEMAALGLAVVRRTAPLLAQASNPDEYDRIARDPDRARGLAAPLEGRRIGDRPAGARRQAASAARRRRAFDADRGDRGNLAARGPARGRGRTRPPCRRDLGAARPRGREPPAQLAREPRFRRLRRRQCQPPRGVGSRADRGPGGHAARPARGRIGTRFPRRPPGRPALGRAAAARRDRPGAPQRRALSRARRAEFGSPPAAPGRPRRGAEDRGAASGRHRHHPRYGPRPRLRPAAVRQGRCSRGRRRVVEARRIGRGVPRLGRHRGGAPAMILEDRVRLLRAVPEIAGLSGSAQATMAAAMGEESFRAGEVILGAGEAADRVLVLSEGTAEVIRGGDIVRRLGRGALMGEIAFLIETVRTATIVAATDCELLSLPFTNFREFLLAHPRGALAVASRVARELVEAEALLTRTLAQTERSPKTTSAPGLAGIGP